MIESWLDILYGLFFYAFVGWIGECIYAYYVHRKLVNRGFLYGPICPIYGVGAMGVSLILQPFEPQSVSMVFLFIAATILCSILEYTTSFVMEKIWKVRWWDYTDSPFNLNGRVALLPSLLWGAGCVVMLQFFNPALFWMFHQIPQPLYRYIAYTLLILLALDLVMTILNAHKFVLNMQTLRDIVQNVKEKGNEQIQALQQSYDKHFNSLSRNQKRMLRAFPTMYSLQFNDQLHDAKKRILNTQQQVEQALFEINRPFKSKKNRTRNNMNKKGK